MIDSENTSGGVRLYREPIAELAALDKAPDEWVDRVSLEVFVNHGELSSTRSILPSRSGISMHADGGAVQIGRLKVFALKSAWGPD